MTLWVDMCVVRAEAELPTRKTVGAAGYDLQVFATDPDWSRRITIDPGEIARLPTGLAMAIPAGYEGLIRPRSSTGLFVHLGTIDSDYRGEVLVKVINITRTQIVLESGDRIAQIVFGPVFDVVPRRVASIEALGATARGANGFGSTGR